MSADQLKNLIHSTYETYFEMEDNENAPLFIDALTKALQPKLKASPATASAVSTKTASPTKKSGSGDKRGPNSYSYFVKAVAGHRSTKKPVPIELDVTPERRTDVKAVSRENLAPYEGEIPYDTEVPFSQLFDLLKLDAEGKSVNALRHTGMLWALLGQSAREAISALGEQME